VTARGLLVTTHASQACSSDPTAASPGPRPRPGPGRRCRQQPAHSPRPERTPRVTARGLLVTTHASQACSSDPTAREPRPPPGPGPAPLPPSSPHTHPGKSAPTSDCTRTASHNTRQPCMQLATRRPASPGPPGPAPGPVAAAANSPAHSPRQERTPRVTARGLLVTTHASHACSSARPPTPPVPVARCRHPAGPPRCHAGQRTSHATPKPSPAPPRPGHRSATARTPHSANPTSDCTRTASHNTRQPSMQLGPDGPRAPAPPARPRVANSPAHSPRQERTPRVTARGLLGATHASPCMQLDPTATPAPAPPAPVAAAANSLHTHPGKSAS